MKIRARQTAHGEKGAGVVGLAGRLRSWNGRWVEMDGQNSPELDGFLLLSVFITFGSPNFVI